MNDPQSSSLRHRSQSSQSHEPTYTVLTLPRPPMIFSPDEFAWIDITNPSFHKVTIDHMVGLEEADQDSYQPSASSSATATAPPPHNEENITEAKQLFETSLQEPLTIAQRQLLLDAIHTPSSPPPADAPAADSKNTNSFSSSLIITPQALPSLVENNPVIAVAILLRMSEECEITEYFYELVSMPLSVHSMEVINRLTNSVQLPKEFLLLYVTKCISTCESASDNKYMQNRLVRLVCAFLQSVLRNRVIDMDVIHSLHVELTTFCLEFSRIREAASLYTQLKQLEAE